MKSKRKRIFEELSSIDARLERERLGMGPYLKQAPRDAEKRRLLLDLAVVSALKADEADYIRVGFRKRRVKL